MEIKNRPLFNEGNVQTIEEVQLSLEMLEHDIPDTRLRAIRNFNATYLVITRNVRQHLRKGTFDRPEFLTQFDTRFAYYYFEALRLHLDSERSSSPWRQAFVASERSTSSSFVCMALGVNAHVNNDIPLVLMDCGASQQNRKDYNRVNSIIKQSIDEVIDSLDSSKELFHPTRRYMRPLYKPLIHILIRIWRYNAWNKYIRLKHHTLSSKLIEHSAHRTGDIIDKMHFI